MKQFLAIFILLCSLTGFTQPVNKQVLFKLQGHSDDLECLAVSGNGSYILSGSWDGMVNLFETDSQYTPVATFMDHFSAVNCISITPNNKTFATGGNDGKVFTYKIDSLGIVSKDKSISIHRMPINALIIDPSGKTVYSGSTDGTICIYDLIKLKDRRIVNTNPISSMALTSDRRTIYCSDNTNTIKKYDLAGKLISSFEGHTDQVNCIVLTKDNKFLVSASSDKSIKIWNTQTGKLVKTLIGHDWKVMNIAVSANGKYIISGSNDGSLILWDFDLGKKITSNDNIGTNVRCVALSNDNTKIFAAMKYPIDSFESGGVLVIKSGIEIAKKEPPKAPVKPESKSTTPSKGATPTPTSPGNNSSGTTKEIIKKTPEIEISEEKKKAPEVKK